MYSIYDSRWIPNGEFLHVNLNALMYYSCEGRFGKYILDMYLNRVSTSIVGIIDVSRFEEHLKTASAILLNIIDTRSDS